MVVGGNGMVGAMAQTVIVQLTDDIDGGEADETVHFSLDGKAYQIDLNAGNAERLREAFAPFIDRARVAARAPEPRPRGRASTGKTLFSQLDAEEKDRFRSWAELPTARRIADARVQEWIDAGKP